MNPTHGGTIALPTLADGCTENGDLTEYLADSFTSAPHPRLALKWKAVLTPDRRAA